MSTLLSKAEYARLNSKEKDAYLKIIFDESDAESSLESDSEDEDWVPSQGVIEKTKQVTAPIEDSDNEEYSVNAENQCVDPDEFIEVDFYETDETDDSEIENEMEEISAAPSDENSITFIAKDKTVWQKAPPSQHQTARSNVVRQIAGPHRTTDTLSVFETFKQIMSPEIVDLIVRYTNAKAKQVLENWNTNNAQSTPIVWKNVDREEMYAFFGILICAGANNSNTDHTTEMWKPSSFPLYRATMGIRRFWNIVRFIRFDDARTRRSRVRTDKVAPIRDIWNMLNTNLTSIYRPTENLTIGEQLYPFQGRTKFTQYMPSKPANYGIKMWWICDAENSYPLKGIICSGKTDNFHESNQGEIVVKELALAYKNSGRNICMDHSFTTLPLAKHLLSWNLTLVGTLRKNKPYIPKEMVPSKTRPEFSTLFGFYEKATICSYVPEKNKAVILLSTMHSDITVNDDAQRKPEIILYYNKYKTGVDTMGQILRRYTIQRRTSRWPLALFFNILDVSALASYIIYYENHKILKQKTNERRIFLRQLSEEMVLPVLNRRSKNQQIMRHYNTKIAIESIIGQVIIPYQLQNPSTPSPVVDKTGRKMVVGSCYQCYQQVTRKRRKTRKTCEECEKPICNEHAITIIKCAKCNGKD